MARKRAASRWCGECDAVFLGGFDDSCPFCGAQEIEVYRDNESEKKRPRRGVDSEERRAGEERRDSEDSNSANSRNSANSKNIPINNSTNEDTISNTESSSSSSTSSNTSPSSSPSSTTSQSQSNPQSQPNVRIQFATFIAMPPFTASSTSPSTPQNITNHILQLIATHLPTAVSTSTPLMTTFTVNLDSPAPLADLLDAIFNDFTNLSTNGAAQETINALGRPDEPITGDCAICRESLVDDEDIVGLPKCKHAFHRECVGAWLKRVPTCPICRSQL